MRPSSNHKEAKVQNLLVSVYLSSLPVAHVSDAPRRQLVVTGDSARIQDETTDSSAQFLRARLESTITGDLGLKSSPTKNY